MQESVNQLDLILQAAGSKAV